MSTATPPVTGQPPVVGHCIYCFRQLTAPGTRLTVNHADPEQLRIVPMAQFPQTEDCLPTFNKLLTCLHRNYGRKQSKLRNLVRGREREEGDSWQPKEFPVLPAMCQLCANRLLDLDKILKLVDKKIEELRKVIVDSKRGGVYQWREKQFEEDLRNNPNVPERSKKATIEFFSGFGIMEEEEVREDANEIEVDTKGFGIGTAENELDCEEPILVKAEVTPDADQDHEYDVNIDPLDPLKDNDCNQEGSYQPIPYSKWQLCEFCKIKVDPLEMRQHMKDHIGEYCCPCPNPACTRVYFTPWKLESAHLVNSLKCRLYAKPTCPCRPTKQDPKGECKCTWEQICEACGYKGNSYELLIHLNSMHERPSAQNYFCPVNGCQVRLATRQSIHFHLRRCPVLQKCSEGHENKFGYCDLCPEKLKSYDVLNHYRSKHKMEEYLCRCPSAICQRAFSSPYSLERMHLITNVRCRKQVKPECPCKVPGLCVCTWAKSCDNCDFTTNSIWELYYHIKSIHEDNVAQKSLVCPISGCHEKFAIKQSVYAHLDMRHVQKLKEKVSEPKYRCDLCSERLTKSQILGHVREHIGDYALTCPCPDCPQVFTSPYKLIQKHLVSSFRCRKFSNPECTCKEICECDQMLSCEKCEFQTEVFIKLRDHTLLEHELTASSSEKTYACPIQGCGEKFMLKQSVYMHLTKHRIPNPRFVKCMECNASMSAEELEDHLKTVHGCQSVISCKACPLKVSSWEALLAHLHKHVQSDSDVNCLTCYLCNDGTKYPLHTLLVKHFFMEHNIGYQYLCEYCNKTFYNETGLRNHVRLKHLEKKGSKYRTAKLFTCEKCQRKFSKLGLRIHQAIKHGLEFDGKLRIYSCNVEGCGKSFKNGNSLRLHKFMLHAGLSVSCHYKCDVDGCSKSYSCQDSLDKHIAAGRCDKCEEILGCQWALRKHRTEKHPRLPKKVARVVCDECGEDFKGDEALRVHKRIHTGERPYQCNLCGQRFRHLSTMNTHMKAHELRGSTFRPNGPMKRIRKRVQRK